MLSNKNRKYSHLTVFESETAQGLRDQLIQIMFDVSIVSMYSDGKKHYAFVRSERPIRTKKETDNGITRQKD